MKTTCCRNVHNLQQFWTIRTQSKGSKSRQKKPELVRLFTNPTEKVQLAAVIASPESVLLMQAPSPLACFTAVEGMFKADLPPTAGILAAAQRLVFRMKGNRKSGEPDTEAVKEFFDEVKSFKH